MNMLFASFALPARSAELTGLATVMGLRSCDAMAQKREPRELGSAFINFVDNSVKLATRDQLNFYTC